MGRAHGKELAADIGAYLVERMRLAGDGSWTGHRVTKEHILQQAEATVGPHQTYAASIHEEVEGMAEAAGVSVAEMILLGGFTDMVDLLRIPVPEDDCTAVLVPPSHADDGYLAQTWDMHDTAGRYIVLCRIEPDQGPAALVYTTAGCVGQMGMNEAGIAIGINNLNAEVGQVGVTWPYVVRKVLQQTDLEAAVGAIMEAAVAGGHNFLVMGPDGDGYDVETMPGKFVVDRLDSRPIVHTNHCLHASTRALEASRPGALTESSHARLRHASELVSEGGLDVDRLWAILSDEESICRRSEPPHHVESCGGIVMRPATRELWASAGIPADTVPQRHGL
jgi:isopenicillin-N N-acyltransferase like protein